MVFRRTPKTWFSVFRRTPKKRKLETDLTPPKICQKNVKCSKSQANFRDLYSSQRPKHVRMDTFQELPGGRCRILVPQACSGFTELKRASDLNGLKLPSTLHVVGQCVNGRGVSCLFCVVFVVNVICSTFEVSLRATGERCGGWMGSHLLGTEQTC